MTTVKLAFLQQPRDPTDTNWDKFASKLVRYIVGRFDHVEIIFTDADNPSLSYACSVFQGGEVFFDDDKGYSRDGYEYLTISGMQPADVQRMENFCFQEAYNRSPFNSRGFYRAGTPFPRKKSSGEWFCSELVATALQQGGLLTEYTPGAMTPLGIYDAICRTVPSGRLHKGTNPSFDRRLKKKMFVANYTVK